MRRKEALEKFEGEHKKEKEKIRLMFCHVLQEQMEQLMKSICSSFDDIEHHILKNKKVDIAYFIFSLMRCDLMNDKAIIRLDVMGEEWFLDDEMISTEIDISFLFQSLFDWKHEMLTDMRTYMGMINKYDVENLVQDEAMAWNGIIAFMMRFAFRDIEAYDAFSNIPKLPFWIIRWGEYKDKSEIVFYVDRRMRKKEEWIESLKEYKENQEALIFTYWYQGNFTEGNCRKKNMQFITFEKCILQGISFKSANMTGARFLNCSICNCDFSKTRLDQALFVDSIIEECCFTNASMQQVLFSQTRYEEDAFDEKQREEILVEERIPEE